MRDLVDEYGNYGEPNNAGVGAIVKPVQSLGDRNTEAVLNGLHGMVAHVSEQHGSLCRDARDLILNLSSQLKAANSEITPLRAQFSADTPLHDQVSAEIGRLRADRLCFGVALNKIARAGKDYGNIAGDMAGIAASALSKVGKKSESDHG